MACNYKAKLNQWGWICYLVLSQGSEEQTILWDKFANIAWNNNFWDKLIYT